MSKLSDSATQFSLPERLAEAISDHRWKQVIIGCSTSQVFQLKSPTGDCLYLKVDSCASDRPLYQEKQKLKWLQGRLPVPEVRMFAEDQSYEYLLLSEIPGVTACDDSLKNDIPKVIEQLAGGLARIHSLSPDQCPFNATLPVKLELARERMTHGLVDESDFDEARLGRMAADLFEELLKTVPSSENLVFTHGDYCLPNIILQDGKLAGFIDWGQAGIADQHQDLALISRSITSNFGPEWVPILFEACGVRPDSAKIHFYMLLDEFF